MLDFVLHFVSFEELLNIALNPLLIGVTCQAVARIRVNRVQLRARSDVDSRKRKMYS